MVTRHSIADVTPETMKHIIDGFTFREMSAIQSGNLAPCEILYMKPSNQLIRRASEYHHMRLTSNRLVARGKAITMWDIMEEFGPVLVEVA